MMVSTQNRAHRFTSAGAAAVMAGSVALPLIIVAESQRGPQTEFVGVLLTALAAAVSYLFPTRPINPSASRQRRLLQGAHLLLVIVVPILFLVAISHWTRDPSGGVGVAFGCVIGAAAGRGLRRLVDRSPDESTGLQGNPGSLFFPFYLAGFGFMTVTVVVAQAPNTNLNTGIVPPPLPTQALVVAVACYVLTGLVLLGQLQYSYLCSHWNGRTATVERLEPRRWSTLALGVTGCAVATSSVVAVAYLTGLFTPLFEFLYNVGTPTVGAVLGLLRVLGVGDPNLLGHKHAHGKIRHFRRRNLGGGRHSHAPLINTGLLLLDSFIVLLVVGIAVYFNRHRLRRYWVRFVAFIRRLFHWAVDRYGGRVGWTLSHATSDEPSSRLSRLRGIFGGALSPRDRVLLAYHRLLRQADHEQLGRRRGATPSEFEQTLSVRLNEAGDDIGVVTQAFLLARYSQRPVESVTADTVDHGWIRVRAALRQYGRR